MRIGILFFSIASILVLEACKTQTEKIGPSVNFQLLAIRLGSIGLNLENSLLNSEIPRSENVGIDFSAAIDTQTILPSIQVVDDANTPKAYSYSTLNSQKTVNLKLTDSLLFGHTYKILLKPTLKGTNKETFKGAQVEFTTAPDRLQLDSLVIDGQRSGKSRIVNIGFLPTIKAYFSKPVQASSLDNSLFLFSKTSSASFSKSLSANGRELTLVPQAPLESLRKYTLQLRNSIKGAGNEKFDGRAQVFYTRLDGSNKLPPLSEEDLLTRVQSQTFKYFWDFAHPVSGLIPERNTSPNVVTLGGTGFGLMAHIVGVERGFITRNEALNRWDKMTSFLKKADRFHGVWPHWMNGGTGKTIPFSPNDDGGDLVETSFLIQGLITVRQYLNPAQPQEQNLKSRIDSLVNEVEWDWYRRGNQDVLYWHWSPRVNWTMNMPIRGWNETLITYVLAASSTTHTIPKSVYTNGFVAGNEYVNGQSYYGFQLPLGPPLGGPLFFSHYSFLGLKPLSLIDPGANYWTQNVNHSKINHAYCVANPGKYVAYSDSCWGLTASDNQSGYSAHSPTNDLGVITPTAALSSFPYTPLESMKALQYFYYRLGDRLWGPYGFYDAFNPTEDWYGNSYLAIDQGPIIIMIENHRTGLLWNLFMSAPEVQSGLTKLGFQY